MNNVHEQFYPPRTRRFSFVDDYKNDVTESLEDTLRGETLSDDDDENNYNTQLLSANLEFLQNEESPDYTLLKLKPSSDSETNERAFSRKYKHRKEPLLFEFSDADAKKTMNIRDEDSDYENSEVDEDNSAEIEKPDGDALKIQIYTEGGVVRPTKHKISSDASGKFIASIDFA